MSFGEHSTSFGATTANNTSLARWGPAMGALREINMAKIRKTGVGLPEELLLQIQGYLEAEANSHGKKMFRDLERSQLVPNFNDIADFITIHVGFKDSGYRPKN